MATTKSTKTAAKKTPAKKAASPKAAPKTTSASKSKTAAPKAPATHHEIAILAEQLWIERGRPHGSSHIDWHHAEQKLKG